jgi:selenocysteine lyase/cysteine desulfurase
VDIDVKALDVDFAVGGMLKYLLGTAGIGFLYCRRELMESLVPTATGWFAQANQQAMDIYHNRPAPTARRFQAGTPPVVNCYAAAAGLDIILELGIGDIERRVRTLTGTCMDRLLEAGCTLATPREDAHRGPSVCIRAADDNTLVAKLAEQNIVTSCRDGNVRATFHCYNDESDIDALVCAVAANRSLLRR